MPKKKEQPPLTRAEEQVMQSLWSIGKGFLKDVTDAMPAPQPHTNTVATLLKILTDKGYVQSEAVGRNNCYKTAMSKQAYSRQRLGTVVKNYFDGSYSEAVSFLVKEKQLSVQDLELLLTTIKKQQ